MSEAAAVRLRLDEVCRRFGELVALDRVSFKVHSGEVVALLGENGAGKSTVVEILVGGLKAHGGRMMLAGREYRPADPRQAWREGVAVVHQHFQLVEAFTVAENLALVLGAVPRSELARRWRSLGELLESPLPSLERVVRSLGVGERQWIEIAKALLVEPTLLLLDEPTAVLTPVEADQLFVAVRRLVARGTTVLFITHRLDEVQRVADRVVVLRRGRVVAELAAGADAGALAVAMTGRVPQALERPTVLSTGVAARLCQAALPPRLEPLDLELHGGRITVLAGVDGNGQVAAAERLAGLAAGPGSVEVGGRSLANPTPHLLRRLGVAVVPADRSRDGVLPTLTVAENAVLGRHRALAARTWWLPPRAVLCEGERLLARFAVAGKPRQAMAELSGGNQQKVVLARALAGRPRVVVAMHPTRGLDVAAQRAVHELLFEAAADGVAVLVVSSDLEEARLLGDRVLVFSRGRVVGEADRTTPLEQVARWVGGDAA